jgi:predicted negative regulator of RcsB-dependent stress response
MVSEKKKFQKSLKAPDQFQIRVVKALDWMNRNIIVLAVPAVVVALGIVGYYVWNLIGENAREARLSELGKIQVVYEEEEKTAETSRDALRKQMEAIDSDIAKKSIAPASAATDALKPATPAAAVAPELTAKKDALQKQVDAIKADHTQSLKQYEDFSEKYQATPEGWLAGVSAANILKDQGKIPDAQALLEKVLTNSKDDRFYQVQGRFLLVGLLEEQGNYDAALKEVEVLASLVDEESQPRVMLAKGRLQMLKKANEDARATFSKLIEAHSSSPEAQKARSLQTLLN